MTSGNRSFRFASLLSLAGGLCVFPVVYLYVKQDFDVSKLTPFVVLGGYVLSVVVYLSYLDMANRHMLKGVSFGSITVLAVNSVIASATVAFLVNARFAERSGSVFALILLFPILLGYGLAFLVMGISLVRNHKRVGKYSKLSGILYISVSATLLLPALLPLFPLFALILAFTDFFLLKNQAGREDGKTPPALEAATRG